MNIRKSLISLVLAIVLVACTFTTAFAIDTYYCDTLYDMGTFSFTDNMTSAGKIIEGRYLTIVVGISKPSWDAGIGDVKLTMDIKDAYTGQSITGQFIVASTSGSTVVTVPLYNIDLGYAGRTIKFWFDASSVGTSNGNYRSLTINTFKVMPTASPI